MLPRRSLGSDGPEVSVLGLGGNVFGPPRLDLAATRRVVDAASDLGVDLVDTANVYNGGASEAFLGEVLEGRRDRWLVATKFNLRGLGDEDLAAHVRDQLEESLRRLRTDRIDLYQLHHAPADDVDMARLLELLDSFVRAGSVRAIGASGFSAWRLAECASLCRDNGWTPFITVQDYWHLLARGIETEVVPYAGRTGTGVIPFHPLGGGYLTGKYAPGVDDVGVIADTQRFAYVVVGDQDADAALLEKADDLLDLQHSDRVDPGERFIEQDETRVGGQRAGDFDAPSLAAGKRRRIDVAYMLDMQFGQQALKTIVQLRFGKVQQLQYRTDVFLDIQLAEHRGFLWQVGKPLAGPAVHRQMGQLGIVDIDIAAIGRHETDDHVETGSLAGTIRAEQADDLAALDLERDILDDGARFVFLAQAMRRQG